MGFLTTITIYNDSAHTIPHNFKGFAEAIYEGILRAHSGNQVIGFQNHANMIEVHRSRHADDPTIYVHMGNCVTEMNAYSEITKDSLKRNPEFFKDRLQFLKEQVKLLEKLYKEQMK